MSDKNLTAVVLAGGRGTRLQEKTKEIPKAMIEVAGRPIFHYSLDFARELGATRVIVSGSHLFDMLSEAVLGYDKSVVMVKDKAHEPGKRILGLVSVCDHIEGDVIIFDGDYIYHPEIAKTILSHEYNKVTVHATLEKSDYMAQDVIVDVDKNNHLLNMFKTAGTQPLGELQTYFNSLFYIPELDQKLFFDISEEARLGGAEHAEEAVMSYIKAGNLVDVFNFKKPLWMEIDDLEELKMGESFVKDYKLI